VIVPISLWWETASERETAYLLKSETMKKRLTAAAQRHQQAEIPEIGYPLAPNRW
jgi:PHD/YefM family antitoxin component YafN of YafNO toxin-antitoxin module